MHRNAFKKLCALQNYKCFLNNTLCTPNITKQIHVTCKTIVVCILQENDSSTQANLNDIVLTLSYIRDEAHNRLSYLPCGWHYYSAECVCVCFFFLGVGGVEVGDNNCINFNYL